MTRLCVNDVSVGDDVHVTFKTPVPVPLSVRDANMRIEKIEKRMERIEKRR